MKAWILLLFIPLVYALDEFVDIQGQIRDNTLRNETINGTLSFNFTIINQSDSAFILAQQESRQADYGVFNFLLNITGINLDYWQWPLMINTSVNDENMGYTNITYTFKSLFAKLANKSYYLGDTHHTGYILTDGSRGLSGNWDVGGYVISDISALNVTGKVNMSSADIFGNVNVTGVSYLNEINLSGNLNMSGNICIGGRCIPNWNGLNLTNSTSEIMTAANSTGLLKNWSYVDTDTDTWNTTVQTQDAVGNASMFNFTGGINVSLLSYLLGINLSGDLNLSGAICFGDGCIESVGGINSSTNVSNQSFYVTISNTGNADYVCAQGTDCAVTINENAQEDLKNTGGTILFNMGNYSLNQTVRARYVGITFMCSAFGGGRYSSGNSCLFTAEKNMTGKNMFNVSNRRIHFKGLVLDGQKRTKHGIAQINGTLQGNGLAGSNHFEDLHIKYQGESGIFSAREIGPANEYERIITSHNEKHGMELRRPDNRIYSYYSYRNANGAALFLNNAGGTQITVMHDFKNKWGIYMNGTDSTSCTNCQLESHNHSAIYFDTTHSSIERITITGGIFHLNDDGVDNRPVFTLNVTSGNDIRNVTFTANVFDDTADIFEFDGAATDIKNVQFVANAGRTDFGEFPPSLYVWQLMDDGTVYTENLAYRGLNVSGSVNASSMNITGEIQQTGVKKFTNGSAEACIRFNTTDILIGGC